MTAGRACSRFQFALERGNAEGHGIFDMKALDGSTVIALYFVLVVVGFWIVAISLGYLLFLRETVRFIGALCHFEPTDIRTTTRPVEPKETDVLLRPRIPTVEQRLRDDLRFRKQG